MATVIKYNDDTIATIGAGQKATLQCEGYTMRDNVVVQAGFDGITYEEFVDIVENAMPVKGVDYNTPEDKAEMVGLVLAALPTWSGGEY